MAAARASRFCRALGRPLGLFAAVGKLRLLFGLLMRLVHGGVQRSQQLHDLTVQLGAETLPMHAAVSAGAERARLWARLVGDVPNFADYQKKTTREIPLVILSRANA